MNTFKIVLMAGLLASVFAAKPCFAQEKDVNLTTPVQGAAAISTCDECNKKTTNASMTAKPQWDGLLDNSAGTAADKAGKAESGTH